jgi:hypothetical protein
VSEFGGGPIVAKIGAERSRAMRFDWVIASQVYYFVDWRGRCPPSASQGYGFVGYFLNPLQG